PWPDNGRLDDTTLLTRIGRTLRAFHDTVADFTPPVDAVWRYPDMAADASVYADARGIVGCHNDPAAWNVVVHDERVVLIDWDVAGPRPPIWDVAYCAVGCMPPSAPPSVTAQRWST